MLRYLSKVPLNPCLSSGFRSIRISASRLGITDTVFGMFNKRVEQEKEVKFEDMIKQMCDTPNWNLKVWKMSLEKQLSSWMKYVPGYSTQAEVLMLKEFLDIMKFMKEEELVDPNRIKGPDRERLAVVSGKGPEKVSNLIFTYKQSLVVHTWIRSRKSLSQTLPSSQHELKYMMESDPKLPAIMRSIMVPVGPRTGRRKSAF